MENLRKVPGKILLTIISVTVLMSSIFAFMPNVQAQENYKAKLEVFTKKAIDESINKEKFSSDGFAWKYDDNSGKLTVIHNGNPEASLTLFDGNTGIVVGVEKLHNYMMKPENGVETVSLKSVENGKPITPKQVDDLATAFGGGKKQVGLKLMIGSELSAQLLDGKDIKNAKMKDVYGKIFNTKMNLKDGEKFEFSGEIQSLTELKEQAKAKIDALSFVDKDAYKEQIDSVQLEDWEDIDSIVDEAILLSRGWQLIEGKWYFYDKETGNMSKGWLLDNGKWYYLDEKTGAMVTGWLLDNGKWYYMNKSGAMVTGWLYYGNNWYCMNKSGSMEKDWVYVDGKWYFMGQSGAMVTGWLYYGNNWYYMNKYGAMELDWVYVNGKWYFMRSGIMVTGRQKIGNTYYRFASNGALIK